MRLLLLNFAVHQRTHSACACLACVCSENAVSYCLCDMQLDLIKFEFVGMRRLGMQPVLVCSNSSLLNIVHCLQRRLIGCALAASSFGVDINTASSTSRQLVLLILCIASDARVNNESYCLASSTLQYIYIFGQHVAKCRCEQQTTT